MDDPSIKAFFNKNSSHNVELHISLQDSSKQGNAEVGETGKRTMWHPSSVLEGELLIASPSELMFREISMFFEGCVRTWLTEYCEATHNIFTRKAERKFLSQAYELPTDTLQISKASSGNIRYSIPYHFIIPQRIVDSGANILEGCVILPPSLEAGSVIEDSNPRRRYAQPSISYQLRATVSSKVMGSNRARTVEAIKPVMVVPFNEESPPLQTADFPAEYAESVASRIRGVFGGTFGEMVVSIQEPPALMYNPSALQSTTNGVVHVELQSPPRNNTWSRLQSLTLTIDSLIRVKTFYSTKPFPRPPSQDLLSLNGQVRLRDEVIGLKNQRFKDLTWTFRYQHDYDKAGDLPGQVDHTVTKTPSPLSRANSLPYSERLLTRLHQLRADRRVSVSGPANSYSSGEPPMGRWMANLTLPINLQTRLPPSFCSSLVARSYSLIVRVKTFGAKPFELEVPLQIVHSPPEDGSMATYKDQRQRAMQQFADSSQPPQFNSLRDLEERPPHYDVHQWTT